jgi:hypothetical protein
MNEIQLSKVRQGIFEVLDKLNIQIKSAPEDKNMFAMDTELEDIDGTMMTVYLYVTIRTENSAVTLEVEIPDEIGEDKITQVMGLVNHINRSPIVGHLFIYLRDKTVFFKQDIILVNGRLNKLELEWTINHLLANAAFYSVDIRRITDSSETPNEMSEGSCDGSYLHKDCRSDE